MSHRLSFQLQGTNHKIETNYTVFQNRVHAYNSINYTIILLSFELRFHPVHLKTRALF